MADIQARHIQWGSTRIEDGILVVELSGPNSKAWNKRFAGVLALLDNPHSGWGEISLTKKGIRVNELQQGTEEQLRHLLESAVIQVNADTEAEENDTQDETESEPDPDEQMATTFRGFAGDQG